MATWMVHLRIADAILAHIPNIEHTSFLLGNIAPDSGVPSEDWSVYTPDKDTSHFQEGGVIYPERFLRKYMTKEQWSGYDAVKKAFYLGYYTHLLSDCLWREKIYAPAMEQFGNLELDERREVVWKFKKDWYDLDHLYLKKHPAFAGFLEYEKAGNLHNTFMEEFSEEAFENRHAYIVDFYRAQHENLEREYIYLDEATMETFVTETAAECAAAVRKWISDN